MRILVTGAAGMLGRAVEKALKGRHDAACVDLGDGDLRRGADVARLFDRHRPEWILHCAAYTDVDRAESDRDEAREVNAGATANLAAACDAAVCGLTAVSTDYVFPGDAGAGYGEDDPRDPVNFYGRTKAEAEEAVEAMSAPGQIVRTSWLFGPGPKNFVRTIRSLLNERESLSVVDDQRGCPTYAPDLAEVLVFLAENGTAGRYHATNGGACTWFELARETARLCGHDPARIRPCASDAYPTPARRPASSVLLSSRLEEQGCPPRPTWQDAVARYASWLAIHEPVAAPEER